ncbi:MAG: rhamnogalacturonan acetylesterase [Acholeplasmataceae bacterium]
MKIFIAGDSTAANKQLNKHTESGWGEFLKDFIAPGIDVRNYAVSKSSTRSFIAEGRLFQIETEIEENDLLLIQFGHNDLKDDPQRHTHPETDYLDNLERFAVTATSCHATPIFLSPITKRIFNNNHLETHTVGDYPNAMKSFCEKHNYPFIDMYKISQRIISKLGENDSKKMYHYLLPDENKNYPDGISDDTNLSTYGAKIYASIIAIELRKYI